VAVDQITAPAQQEEPPPAATVVANAAPAQQEQLPPPATVVATAAPAQQEQLPPPATVVATAAPAQQEQLPPAPTVVATAVPAQQEQLPPAATVATAAPPQQEEVSSELNRTIEKLQADLVISTTRVAELERAKSVAERALAQAGQAKLDAENAKQQAEQARVAENASSHALIGQLRAEKATAGTKIPRWEIVLYGAIGGVLFFLATSAIGSLIKRGTAQSQVRRTPRQPSAESAGIAISEAAFERDLEEAVATINAPKAMLGSGLSAVAKG
jgi:hypothetical protein